MGWPDFPRQPASPPDGGVLDGVPPPSQPAQRKHRYWIRRYIIFHNKQHPRTVGTAEIGPSSATWLHPAGFGVHAIPSSQRFAVSLPRSSGDRGWSPSRLASGPAPGSLACDPFVRGGRGGPSSFGGTQSTAGGIALWRGAPHDQVHDHAGQGPRFQHQRHRSPAAATAPSVVNEPHSGGHTTPHPLGHPIASQELRRKL